MEKQKGTGDGTGSIETIEIAKAIHSKGEHTHAEKAQWEGFINYICNYVIPNFLVNEYYTYSLQQPIISFVRSQNYSTIYDEYLEKYAKILGYNYNSSKWFEQSYKILNKEYKPKKIVKDNKNKDENSLFKKVIKMIK